MSGPESPTEPNMQPLDVQMLNPHVARVVPRDPLRVPRRRRSVPTPGLLADEREIWARRQSRIYIALPGLPLLLGLVALLLLQHWIGTRPGVFFWVVAAVLGVFTLRWLLGDVATWFYTVYFLTSQRVIKQTGFFNRSYEESPLKHVVDVTVDLPNVFEKLLGIGHIDIETLSNSIVMKGLGEARDLADLIRTVQRNPSFGLAAKPAVPALPMLQQHGAQGARHTMANPWPVHWPTPAQAVEGPRRSSSRFRRSIPMRFMEGEQVIELVYRHWIALLRSEVPAALIVLITGVLAVTVAAGGDSARLAFVLSVGPLISAVVAGAIYINWADDVLILTTHRVVDVDRLFFILAEYSTDVPYARIQGVEVTRNWLGGLFGFGNIRVFTTGRRRQIEMSLIPNAARVMDRIYGQKSRLEAQEAANAAERIREENAKWFATIGSKMFTKVPDLRGMHYLDAANTTHELGLRLVVREERAQDGVAPGVVLEQDPTGDIVVAAEGEVQVVLSRQPVGVRP